MIAAPIDSLRWTSAKTRRPGSRKLFASEALSEHESNDAHGKLGDEWEPVADPILGRAANHEDATT